METANGGGASGICDDSGERRDLLVADLFAAMSLEDISSTSGGASKEFVVDPNMFLPEPIERVLQGRVFLRPGVIEKSADGERRALSTEDQSVLDSDGFPPDFFRTVSQTVCVVDAWEKAVFWYYRDIALDTFRGESAGWSARKLQDTPAAALLLERGDAWREIRVPFG